MKALNLIAQVLLIIGGLNWGLIGLFEWNLVSAIFGIDTWFTNFIYILVGLSAIWGIYMLAPLARGSELRTARPATATDVRTTPPPR